MGSYRDDKSLKEGFSMIFNTLGNPASPAVLFFHAMGVTGESSIPVAEALQDHYYCIMPTSTVYCPEQKYISKQDEIYQIESFLSTMKIKELPLVVASSLGADLALTFLAQTRLKVDHVYFDGGQFAQINSILRHIMTPFLYLGIKSLYWSKGNTLKHILWCDDEQIKPYFIDAGKNLTYGNLHRQMKDSVINKPFPSLPVDLQQHTYWEFGSIEDHYKYRDNVIKSYPHGHFPVFDQYNHMQYQIRDPQGFADMLLYLIDHDCLPDLPFLK